MRDSRTKYHEIACVVIALSYLLLWALSPFFKGFLGDNVLLSGIAAIALCFIISIVWEQIRRILYGIQGDWNDVKYGTIAGSYATVAFIVIYQLIIWLK